LACLGLLAAGGFFGVQLRPGLLAPDDLAGEPGQRHRGPTRAQAAVFVILAEQRVLGGIGGLRLGEPRVHPGGQQRLQLADLNLQLLRSGVRRHRRVRLDLRPIPGHHIHAHQALRRACHQRLNQQALQRPLMPGHEPGHGGVIGVQVLRQHPRPPIIEGGHLHRPRRPDPRAVAVHDQRHHQRRVIRLLPLPIGPVPGHERRQVHPGHRRVHRPRQVPRRQPLPRIGRQQPPLIDATATSEVVPQTTFSQVKPNFAGLTHQPGP